MSRVRIGRKLFSSNGLAGLAALATLAVAAGSFVVAHDVFRDDDECVGSCAGGAFLGVVLDEETDHPDGGALVERVVRDSPAEAAGIEKGDIIQGFNGDAIRGPRGLGKRIDDTEAGDSVSLRLLRDGREMTLDVELQERSDHHGWSSTFHIDPEELEEMGDRWRDWGEHWREFGEQFEGRQVAPRVWAFGGGSRPKLGVQLADTTPELREHLGSDGETGVLVSKVMQGMPAETAGIEVGDLIVAVDGVRVGSSGELVDELGDKEGESFTIEVVRDGRSREISVSIPEREKGDRATGPRAFFVPPAPPAPVAPRIHVVVPIAPVAPAPPLPGIRVLPVPTAPVAPAPPEADGDDGRLQTALRV